MRLLLALTLCLGLTATAIAAAGDPARGKKVFTQSGCGACHTFSAAGSRGQVGPDLDATLRRDAKAAGKPLAAFVRESILRPNAYLARGFPKGVMPSFAGHFTARDLDDLVAFVVGTDLSALCLRAGDLPGSAVTQERSHASAFQRDLSGGRLGQASLHAAACAVTIVPGALQAGILFSQTAGSLLRAHPGVAALVHAAFPAEQASAARITRRRKLPVGDGAVELAATVRVAGAPVDFSVVSLRVGRAVGSVALLGRPGSHLAAADVAALAKVFAGRVRGGLASTLAR